MIWQYDKPNADNVVIEQKHRFACGHAGGGGRQETDGYGEMEFYSTLVGSGSGNWLVSRFDDDGYAEGVANGFGTLEGCG